MVKTALSRDEALRLLREHMPVLRERFGVSELALFGSTARNEARPESDVDILVSFNRKPDVTWASYDAETYLTEVIGRRVDLVERHLMRREYFPWVDADAVDPMNPRECMPGQESRPKRWDIYVDEMNHRCDRVMSVTDGLDYESYEANLDAQELASFNLAQVGEAANKIPVRVREAHAEIDWDLIIGLRHRLIHACYPIKQEKLWEIIRQHVPELTKRLQPLLAEAQAEVQESGQG